MFFRLSWDTATLKEHFLNHKIFSSLTAEITVNSKCIVVKLEGLALQSSKNIQGTVPTWLAASGHVLILRKEFPAVDRKFFEWEAIFPRKQPLSWRNRRSHFGGKEQGSWYKPIFSKIAAYVLANRWALATKMTKMGLQTTTLNRGNTETRNNKR